MAFQCISQALESILGKYARIVFRHSLPFLLAPIFLTLCLCSGVIYLNIFTDIEYLFTPTNAESKKDGDFVDSIYTAYNGNGMLVNRISFCPFGSVIISGKKHQNILQENEFEEVLRIHNVITNILVIDSGYEYTYRNICASWLGNCISNPILDVYSYNATLVNQRNIFSPVTLGKSGEIFRIGSQLGDIQFVKESNTVISAKYIMLTYYLNLTDVSGAWEKEFLSTMELLDSKLLKITYAVSSSAEDESTNAAFSIVPLIPIAFAILVTFSVLSSASSDWVQNKPTLTLLGVLSAILGTCGATGLVLLTRVKFTIICALTPIIIVSIGIDDMYILMASWRKTSVLLPAIDRLSATLSEAAVSITITSLTDCLAFAVGCTSSIPAVSTFCVFNTVAILFVYTYVLTFFLSCMAIMGRREENKKHCITWKTVLPIDQAPSLGYKIFCAGGPTKSTTINSDSSHIAMFFFRNYFGPLIGKIWMKASVLIVYAVYLAFSIWSLMYLKQGLDERDIFVDDSYIFEFKSIQFNHFQKYGPAVQIVIKEDVKYWEPEVRNEIVTLTELLETCEFGISSGFYTDSWIRTFNEYLTVTGRLTDNRTIYLNILRNEFLLRNEFKHFELDLIFNENKTAIVGSRFLVGSRKHNAGIDTGEDVELMNTFREIVANASFKAIAFTNAFKLYDQYEIMLSTTVINIGIALAAMFLVSILLIPKLVCSLWVIASVASIETGVLGLMSFWGVRLDSISMVTIIIGVGFSVDFTAHMSYTYAVSPSTTRNGKLIDAYYTIGMPISQAAISTLLGIMVLVNSEVGIYRGFFKTAVLVITIGWAHCLLFLPVIMSLFPVGKSHKSTYADKDHIFSVSKTCTKNTPVCNLSETGISVTDNEKNEIINLYLTNSKALDINGTINPAFIVYYV